MKRRDFLNLTAVMGGGVFLAACNSSDVTNALPEVPADLPNDPLPDAPIDTTPQQPKPEGAVTYYTEIRVAGPEKATVLGKIDTLIQNMQGVNGYLGISLKQMTGESTMVKNYPNNLKGVLDRGFVAPAQPAPAKVPFFYSLFVRFDTYDNLLASGVEAWFKDNIVPSLFAYNAATTPPTKTPVALDYYAGVFVTVAAGDRNAIYTEQADILNFLQNQADEVNGITAPLITVENHVMINDKYLEEFNAKVKNLLTIAQTTYMPLDVEGGKAGTSDVNNTDYHKAVTTEIMQNAFADGDLRAYIMHGVWESVWDHENSHIDVRFQQAAGPVGAYVVVGPVEPFYDTIKQDGVAQTV